MNEQEKAVQRKQWALKKLFALKVIEILGRGNYLTVWQHEGEKGVFINEGYNSLYGCKISYSHTGNNINHPGSLIIFGWRDTSRLRGKALEICEKACKEWESIEIDCDAVAESNFELA
ncbi:MAG: hypothetical protein JOZ78_13675 [Chroococcidiopsidaceae cyanobacterium CP_BM_ER_R8_30]|nr:hypothetical protein [Chroococcidiopsidaceae cyanobacterium CP_BM_ER_R8_30]